MQNTFFKRMVTALIASVTGFALMIQPLAVYGSNDADSSFYDWSASTNQTAAQYGATNGGSNGGTFTGNLSDITVSTTKFDPVTQGTMSVNLTVNNVVSSLNVSVQDMKGNVVYVLDNTATAGSKVYIWNGRNSSGSNVANGLYKIKAVLNGSESKEKLIMVIPASNNDPNITNIAANPAVIGANQSTTVTYKTEATALIRIEVDAFGSNVALRNAEYTLNAGNQTWSWDGRDDNGQQVANGDYNVIVSAFNTYEPGGESMPIKVTVSGTSTGTTGTVFTTFGFTPSTFNPTLGGATISFNLSYTASVTFTVRDATGAIVYTTSNVYGTNAQSFTWDGRANTGIYAGSYLPNGTYSYTLSATNSATGAVDTRNGSFTVDSNAQTQICTGNVPCASLMILNTSVAPAVYNPIKNQLQVSYFILGQANVTVTIMKDQYVVRQLKNSLLETGNNTAYWNGKDATDVTYVPNSTYTYRIVATYNNVTDMKEGTFTVSSSDNPNTYCAGYSDVRTNSPYCNALVEMKKQGVFTGYPDGTFKPDQEINRAETVKVMMLVLKYNVPLTGWYFDSAGFKDVYSGAYYTPYLAAARLYGIINGYPDKTFKPTQTVNRAELSKIFLEASNIANQNITCEKPYTDKTKGTWFAKYACLTKYYSLVDAIKGKFAGATMMTRGDVAVMLFRAQTQGLLKSLPPKPQINFYQIQQYQYPFKSF